MKKLLGIIGICLWAILAGGCRQDSSSGRFEEPEEIVTDFVSEYEIAEVSPGEAMKIPAGICQLDDLIIVCDKGNHCLLVFDNNGNLVETHGTLGNSPGELMEPTGIMTVDGLLYILDAGNHRIQIWNSSFNYVDQIILEPLTHAQGGRNYIDLAMDKEGCIYVSTDSVGERDAYIYVIKDKEVSTIGTPFTGYLGVSDGIVYAMDTLELYVEGNSESGASGENSLYRINGKEQQEVYKLPNKLTPNDFCICDNQVYVISSLWGILCNFSLDNGEVAPVCMLESYSLGQYMTYIPDEDTFWVSDTVEEKLYKIFR